MPSVKKLLATLAVTMLLVSLAAAPTVFAGGGCDGAKADKTKVTDVKTPTKPVTEG